MKPGPNIRRTRSRGNGRRFPSKNQSYESNGPDVKVRGTVQQVLEKYLALARDASSSGDRVTAEGYFQHAEHYYRLLNNDANTQNGQARQNDRDANGRPNSPAHDPADNEADGEGDGEGNATESATSEHETQEQDSPTTPA